MTEILEYISLNYTWFLIGAIIILLAIIGSYADKTNFGQGKDKLNLDDTPNKDLEESLDLLDNVVDNNLNLNAQNEVKSNDENKESEVQGSNINNNTNNDINNNNIEQTEKDVVSNETEIENNHLDDFEESFNKFDQEFNALMPKKDIIDVELLDDIDSLSLDKTQKFNIRDIPDLDDVELPKIKDFKTDEKNIWKF